MTTYTDVVNSTKDMTHDPQVRDLVQQQDLNILNVLWEDTARFKGSAVGPNISDVTIQVQHEREDGRKELSCMPVIRHPNFTDLTGDIPIDHFYLRVGNEKGEDLKVISLREYLDNIRDYMTDPTSWKGERQSLLADSDTHVLASAQACFLPIPENGEAEFNPVIFNYQSREEDPAVLTIVATREGTSVTVIDNQRDGFEDQGRSGQRLFFNKNGERAVFSAKRLTDHVKQEAGLPADANVTVDMPEDHGLNMVLMIQVPLRPKPRPRMRGMFATACSVGTPMNASLHGKGPMFQLESVCNVEEAVVGHGRVEGPYTEMDNLEIKRDARYPIRVTVQFYQATSNGVVDEDTVKNLADQIQRVYDDADFVGSLVVEDSDRPTEYKGSHRPTLDWWGGFWVSHEETTGMTALDTMVAIRKALDLDSDWVPETEDEMKEALVRAAEAFDDITVENDADAFAMNQAYVTTSA